MKNKSKYFTIVALIFLVIGASTHLLSNAWLLITDHSNYIPHESNLFFFNPTQIDEGSGGYWRYGEDRRNYYYFSIKQSNVYYRINKENSCQSFLKTDFTTWCERNKFIQ